jgi:hypothetical protein
MQKGVIEYAKARRLTLYEVFEKAWHHSFSTPCDAQIRKDFARYQRYRIMPRYLTDFMYTLTEQDFNPGYEVISFYGEPVLIRLYRALTRRIAF